MAVTIQLRHFSAAETVFTTNCKKRERGITIIKAEKLLSSKQRKKEGKKGLSLQTKCVSVAQLKSTVNLRGSWDLVMERRQINN